MDTSHESAHERLHTTTIALAPLKPDSAVALMQVRTGEPVGKKGRIPLFPHFVTREHNCNFSSLSPRFPPLPPTNLSRCSLSRRIEGSNVTSVPLRSIQKFAFLKKKEREKEICVDSPRLDAAREGSRRPRQQRMTPVVSVFHRFRFGHAARATRTHRVSAPTHARIYTRVGASPLLGSPSSLIPSRFLSLRFP